ncbi:MAG: tRNA uridine-5-carboxymethylaminomethyl(34) synthesis GTPase MnmE [Rickettsiales bacterium TMED289]|nr:MAG: tRNA uridine-5-carboxymethylaminomethyl(34) synthesis GTPase MnmE [Rickettsiales bacterium TMED289]|tara:strand:- start:101 stop:1486 length:1386 start_codon:yes stop_codon:yes gene_type:complete
MIKTDNIVAIASPPGKGAISLIRISGNNCISQIDNIFYGFEEKKLIDQESHKLQLGYIKDGDEIIDKVLVTVFRNPKSYTGEDLVEISCHGSIYIQEKILQTILSQKCRIADPGEFTLRSFINGKMDLSEAEAVADLISSNTKASHKLALNQMRGGFKSDINRLREELVNFASLIELELDFSQEDVEFANINKLNDLVLRMEKKLTDLIKSFKIGNVIKNGLPIVIIGKPNSGKSTLLNCLLNEEKAIVSSVPGTTRDSIEDEININGIKCRFIDTAGIRKTDDKIENLGIKKTYKKIEEAEIILYLIDKSILNNKNIDNYLSEISKIKKDFNEKEIIVLINKCDIKAKVSDDNLISFSGIQISAKQGLNIENLIDRISIYMSKLSIDSHNVIVTNSRHLDLLSKTLNEIKKIKLSIKQNISSDLLSIEIKQASYFLGELTGEISNDELLGNIFSKFCIGK